ncbi:hypothetical protein Hypma_005080 [Hypsizygus marmoreus]|uniref:Uncharacterized protein n=1 Tax=Hypsizygus marmoreus TaxID=39966 RepID=A0A369K551_HYPMA|nr:hypothetical protein Hypma_005080 [Hypsizygus marmoreus]
MRSTSVVPAGIPTLCQCIRTVNRIISTSVNPSIDFVQASFSLFSWTDLVL